jgi:hypothetical protein
MFRCQSLQIAKAIPSLFCLYLSFEDDVVDTDNLVQLPNVLENQLDTTQWFLPLSPLLPAI